MSGQTEQMQVLPHSAQGITNGLYKNDMNHMLWLSSYDVLEEWRPNLQWSSSDLETRCQGALKLFWHLTKTLR